MHVWNVLHTAHWKYRTQKITIKLPSGHYRKLCPAISSQLRHVLTIGKNLWNSYLLHMSPQHGELWPTNGWDPFQSLGHTIKFQRVSRLGFITAAMSLTGGQQNSARSLAISWAGTLYIHFWGLLPPNRILPAAKFTLRLSLVFSCIDSITARHLCSGRQPNFVVWYNEYNYRTSTDGATYIWLGGHHVGHRPTI